MAIVAVLQQAPRANGEDDQEGSEVDESAADDDDPEQELNVSTVGSIVSEFCPLISFVCQVGDASGKRFEEYRKFLAKVYPKFIHEENVECMPDEVLSVLRVGMHIFYLYKLGVGSSPHRWDPVHWQAAHVAIHFQVLAILVST